jgi:predicted RNA-binding protein with PUA-like domain
LATVARVNVIDETQFDPKSPYFDPKATRDKPRWDCVDVRYVETLPNYVELGAMREDPALAKMMLLKRGMRLSVQPVTAAEYKRIVAIGRAKKRSR